MKYHSLFVFLLWQMNPEICEQDIIVDISSLVKKSIGAMIVGRAKTEAKSSILADTLGFQLVTSDTNQI